MNIKNNFKNFYNNFKKETALINTYLTPPKKWEQLVSIFLIIIYCIFEYMRINDIEPLFWVRSSRCMFWIFWLDMCSG